MAPEPKHWLLGNRTYHYPGTDRVVLCGTQITYIDSTRMSLDPPLWKRCRACERIMKPVGLLSRTSTAWGLAVRYAYGGKTDQPLLAGRFWDKGEWQGCCARTYRTREEARQAARRTRQLEPRSDGWKVFVKPIRVRITTEEIE